MLLAAARRESANVSRETVGAGAWKKCGRTVKAAVAAAGRIANYRTTTRKKSVSDD